jgi:hypothetical protein
MKILRRKCCTFIQDFVYNMLPKYLNYSDHENEREPIGLLLHKEQRGVYITEANRKKYVCSSSATNKCGFQI